MTANPGRHAAILARAALIQLLVMHGVARAAADRVPPPIITAPASAPPADAAAAHDAPIPGDKPAPVTLPGAAPDTTVPIVATPTGPDTAPVSSPITPVAQAVAAPAATAKDRNWYQSDPDAYSIVSAGKGLSLHKPMYLQPLTWSPEYSGKESEMLFQISLKQRLFGIPLYFGYTQKSFFDVYDEASSKPFRETNYNPELFYRFIPADRERWYHLGADAGIEHESNGRSLPDSRSWNRIYIAPFQAQGSHLIYWKWWWRLPENKDKPADDPGRDDNPDIGSYYGYSELHLEKQLFSQHLANVMVRYNPATGRAAAQLEYSLPGDSDASFFWMFYVWQGYGESLIDYNRSLTRVGLGVMLAR